MHFYRVLYERSGMPADVSHFGTQADAREGSKGYQKRDRPYVRVELIDVPTDKEGVLALLRGAHSITDFEPLRTWKLGQRGGLIEIANGE